MILDRLYDPGENERIYHYCRPEIFLEIIRSRTMWASAYYAMNDSMEREWGYSIFARVAKQMQEQVDNEFVEHIAAMIKIAYRSMPMLSCYSLDADVLSQWRAYGDDGRGFAIGFSPKLMRMSGKKLRVLYDEAAQIKELTGNLMHTYEYEKSIGFKFNMEFQAHWFNVGLDLSAYKNPAFKEEREIRIVHLSGLVSEGEISRIVPLGARDEDGKRLIEPIEVRFRVSNGTIIPFVALDYTNRGENSPIKEIVLGPRNENAVLNIELFLNSVGVRGVSVRRSSVPYR